MQGKQLWEALRHEIEGRNRQEKRQNTVVHVNIKVFFTVFQNNYTVLLVHAYSYSTKKNFMIVQCIQNIFICTKVFISHFSL